jgi:glycosyltransferase involved in cell wall biosynthesis
MACGCPVVASDVGGLRDSINHLESGFLVPTSADFVERLGDAINYILSNPDIAESLAINALGKIRENNDWFNIAKRMNEIYYTLLNKKLNQV